MSAHTPGPWFPVRYGAEKTQWHVLRDLRDSGGLCQFMKDAEGRTVLFDSEEDALAAIAKATGSTT